MLTSSFAKDASELVSADVNGKVNHPNSLDDARDAPKLKSNEDVYGLDRRLYRGFWDRYSTKADLTSMMLNANAEELDAVDRAEILSYLPDVNGKEVVDIGAGIGRFTTIFAQTAKHVVSADFIENFMQKNHERNAQFKNIEYRTSDALGLEFPGGSIDLVFTNWLLMYLSDDESVDFVGRSLRWLRPGGHLHIRESCSEPSTKKSSTSLHQNTAVNPTRYRFSSTYIELFRHIHFTNAENGSKWRFDLKWAKSVSAYVERQQNWRQVHFLLEKVECRNDEGDDSRDGAQILAQFKSIWPEKQLRIDEELEMEGVKTAQTLAKAIESVVGSHVQLKPGSLILGFSPRRHSSKFHINPFAIANKFDVRIWTIETNSFCYRHSLTCSNRIADRRVRFSWNENLKSALEFWQTKTVLFDALISTELVLAIKDSGDAKALKELLSSSGSFLLTAESVNPGNPLDLSKFNASMALLKTAFHVCSIKRIAQHSEHSAEEWILVLAKPMASDLEISRSHLSGKEPAANFINGGF